MGRSHSRFLFLIFFASVSVVGRAADETPEAIFKRRIEPIFRSPKASSCAECHLAVVDLKNYLLPSHEQTFLSLRDQGLIDLDRPEQSHILELINRRVADPANSSIVHETIRKQESEAIAAWIVASAKDARLRTAPPLDRAKLAAPQRPVEIIRHARKDQLLESFENSVWAMRFRCMNCHTEGSAQNDKLVKENGEQVAWMKKGGAAATLDYLLESGLINRQRPDQSMLLLKPLNRVKHGGGLKFVEGDQGYKAFRAWIEDAVKTLGDKYSSPNQLPRDDGLRYFGTELWFKLSNTPAEWGDRLVQADIYAWNASANAWEPTPIASTDRGNNPKMRVMQHTLTLATQVDSENAKRWQAGPVTLPQGKYLVRVYVDRQGKLARNWQTRMSDADYVGQAEFSANWRTGYGAMTVVDAAGLRRLQGK